MWSEKKFTWDIAERAKALDMTPRELKSVERAALRSFRIQLEKRIGSQYPDLDPKQATDEFISSWMV